MPTMNDIVKLKERQRERRTTQGHPGSSAAPELTSRELLALVESARDLSSEIDLDEVLAKILNRACQLTGSESASIILHDGRGLFAAAAVGPKAVGFLATFGETGPERVKFESKAGRVFATGAALVESSIAEDDPEHFKEADRKLGHHTESMVCVSLETGSDRIGVIQILNKPKGGYTPTDVVLLQHFASHAAVVIRNARLVQELLARRGLFTELSSGRRTIDLIRELSAPAHEERLTVMFADLRGFTTLSRDLGSPLAIEKHVNDFMRIVADEIMRYDGLVNKFLGDGVLALFRGRASETRATRAAFGILERFDKMKAEWVNESDEELDYLDVGIGIVTGEVVIGSIGSGRVRDFTVLGKVVNLAAAFEQNARGGKRVLVSQSTYRAIADIVDDFEELPRYEMRKPDQDLVSRFRCYHIRRLLPSDPKDETDAGEVNLDAYYRSSWAVVVGVNEYSSPNIAPLSYAIADARAVADALPALGFPSDQIQVLENETALKQNIERAILGLHTQMRSGDRLLVFFAVHGQVAKNRGGEEGYLLPYDADPNNLPMTCLSMSNLALAGRSLQAKHILFVLDTCFSGHATSLPRSLPTEEMRDRVVQIMTAGTSGQRAAEENGHGVFTREFLNGLRGGADPEGQGLTAMKLTVYIQDQLNGRRTPQIRQTPLLQKLDGEGEFYFLPPRERMAAPAE